MKTNRIAVLVSAALLGAACLLPGASAQAETTRTIPRQGQPPSAHLNPQPLLRTTPQPNMNQIQRPPQQEVPHERQTFRGPNPPGS